ncbi:MAG: ferrous iron transport protein B [Clostridiaceae bacterium]|nr:ferrous iron transport protein B [Clostridiaceae bacterium]
MGLTKQSTGSSVLGFKPHIERQHPGQKIIALAGNPNVGKSTVFNSLTGMRQHTGNWPGKTVSIAQGSFFHKGVHFLLVDIPGTYSLMANSVEEGVARDFICFGDPDAVIVVTDATCLERNLNLVLQVLEVTGNVVVCVNLIDDARRRKIRIDLEELSRLLGVTVAGTSARSGKGLDRLMDEVWTVTHEKPGCCRGSPLKIRYHEAVESAVGLMEPSLEAALNKKLCARWTALRLLEGDENLLESIRNYLGYDLLALEAVSNSFQKARKILIDAGIDQDLFRDIIVSGIVRKAEEISRRVVAMEEPGHYTRDRKIDRVLTSRTWGIPIMIAMLGVILWITITGANYPSALLADALFWVEDQMTALFLSIGAPAWLHGLLVTGMYRTLAWVVSVMLPPMAIFFPLFTLLEDLGYLPRVAFNLDSFFKKACAHGKQALTMCMGFGCNAAGVVGCRIIDSPRERLIATITNSFVPCNGRFPTLIAIITMFFAGIIEGPFRSVISALMLTGVILLGVMMTLLVSRILSRTILKGLPSSFTLELPPYRKPQVGRILVRSLLDRTLFVLGRAVAVAAPAGMVIWAMSNIHIGGLSLLSHCAGFLDPFARLIGMDGCIIMAFILGFPANEIVIPLVIMSYMSTGSMMEFESLVRLRELLAANGWTWLTAVCVMLFSLMHWPCSTTCLTIRKETQSWKWTLISFLVPTAAGILICFITASVARLLGLS